MKFETYRDIGGYERSTLSQAEPSCFNGVVRVVKYCVTVEQGVEPDAVIHARLRKLWSECDNYHHREPLIRAGKQYGIDLRHDA